jgi:methyl-accepting chemotaxis protein
MTIEGNVAVDDAVTASLASQCEKVGVHAAIITGEIEDIGSRIAEQTREVATVDATVQEMTRSNAGISEVARDLAAAAAGVTERMSRAQGAIKQAMGNVIALVDDVTAIESRLPSLQEALSQVSRSSGEIDRIAHMTNILALNATIEAARAGEAGKGFAVVAQEVKELSRRTTESVQGIESTVANLNNQVAELIRQSQSAADQAASARAGGGAIGVAMGDMEAVGQDIAQVAERIAAIAEQAERNRRQGDVVAAEVASIHAFEDASKADAESVSKMAFHLMKLSADLNYSLASMGVQGPEAPYIAAVREAAATITRQLTEALDRGEIDMATLFDENYVQMPDIEPPKYTTRWLPLIERVVPPVCEPLSRLGPDVVLCTITDRNAYMPVNNERFSAPPRKDDPVWNASHSRQRIRHRDRISAEIARSTKPFMVIIFRRRLGDSTQILRDVSAPIVIRGTLWGNVRMLLKTSQADSPD